MALIAIACYQQVQTGNIDKYIIGALLVITLSALGWRLDVLLESYAKYRYGGSNQQSREEADDEK